MEEEKDKFKLIYKFLCNDTNIRIIMALCQIQKKSYSYSNIAKISHVTLSHVIKIIRILTSAEILEIGELNRKEAQIKLSEKGKQIALKLNELRLLINS